MLNVKYFPSGNANLLMLSKTLVFLFFLLKLTAMTWLIPPTPAMETTSPKSLSDVLRQAAVALHVHSAESQVPSPLWGINDIQWRVCCLFVFVLFVCFGDPWVNWAKEENQSPTRQPSGTAYSGSHHLVAVFFFLSFFFFFFYFSSSSSYSTSCSFRLFTKGAAPASVLPLCDLLILCILFSYATSTACPPSPQL